LKKRNNVMSQSPFRKLRKVENQHPHMNMSGGIFSLQFNTNACLLKGFEERIFAGAANAAVVICAFQEYDLAPVIMMPQQPTLLLSTEESAEPCPLQREAYMRYRETEGEELDSVRLAAIKNAIGESFELVADVAMGETAGMIKLAEGDKKKLEWYGHIRLIIFARPDLPAGATLCDSRDNGDLYSCVIPCGDKASGNDTREGAALDEPDSAYPKGLSPDKGAVCVYFPTAKLLVISAHLHGTNKPKPESEFNIIRERQLRRIGQGATWLVKEYQPTSLSEDGKEEEEVVNQITSAAELKCSMILCGDLNFRVESEFITPEDKDKGGNDFKFVEPLASSESPLVLSDLMENNDLFYKLLRNPEDEKPPILVRSRDAVAETVCKQRIIVPPTFTFTQDAPYPRKYKNKRTPSWPDRIVFRDLNYFFEEAGVSNRGVDFFTGSADNARVRPKVASLRYCQSLREVVCSDHEAVVAYFDFDSEHGSGAMSGFWGAFDDAFGQVTGSVGQTMGDTMGLMSCQGITS